MVVPPRACFVCKYLMVVPPRACLVPKEVDLLVSSALYILQTECLVPAFRETVDGDLAALCKLEAQVAEPLLQLSFEGVSDAVLLIKLGKLVPLLEAAASPHRAEVDQARPELYEGSPLGRQLEGGHVSEGEVDEVLAGALAQLAQDAASPHQLPAPVRHLPITPPPHHSTPSPSLHLPITPPPHHSTSPSLHHPPITPPPHPSTSPSLPLPITPPPHHSTTSQSLHLPITPPPPHHSTSPSLHLPITPPPHHSTTSQSLLHPITPPPPHHSSSPSLHHLP